MTIASARRSAIGTVFLLATLFSPVSGVAQTDIHSSSPADRSAWRSDSVILVAGLARVKPNSPGTLRLTAEAIVFSGKTGNGDIPFDRIRGVSIGDERIATGGRGAKVARMIPIYGFGAAMGAVTNKRVDLLTIEYSDSDNGYHGAVFEVPKTQAEIAQQQLAALPKALPVAEPAVCNGPIRSRTLLVSPIVVEGIDLPAEYRVLLYEQLVSELKEFNPGVTIDRTGDAAAPCAAAKLELSVLAFKKGNEAIRASTGPVGLFAGTTSLKFEVSLVDSTGKVLFVKALKTSKHGDGDSLSVTHELAKSVSKRLAKTRQVGSPSTS